MCSYYTQKIKSILLTIFTIVILTMALFSTISNTALGADPNASESLATAVPSEILSQPSILSRAWESGPIVFLVLFILIGMSVATWSVAISKYLHLVRTESASQKFITSFWESRSLNDLNSRLGEYPPSPVREVFRTGYAEVVRASQMRENHKDLAGPGHQLIFHAAIENLTRTLQKAKNSERRRLEKFLQVLAISASASPFIGLFGTVWGIMGAFEGIARTGSASLSAVAPGISEALIATAFGLAAAIPALVGYNISQAKIRQASGQMDGFIADFLNIVERYLVSDKLKSQSQPLSPEKLSSSPAGERS